MYGKGLGLANTAVSIPLLTPHHNHIMFLMGQVMLVGGLAVFTASVVLSRVRSLTK